LGCILAFTPGHMKVGHVLAIVNGSGVFYCKLHATSCVLHTVDCGDSGWVAYLLSLLGT
jgi:hypothetical protein